MNSIEEQHVMSLSEALEINLLECGFVNRDVSLWEWLRERNYKGVEYNHNFDNI